MHNKLNIIDVFVYVYVFMYVNVFVCMHVYDVCMYTYICIYSVYTHIGVCMCVYVCGDNISEYKINTNTHSNGTLVIFGKQYRFSHSCPEKSFSNNLHIF